jgi:outer membrane biosynthesis protein TonB
MIFASNATGSFGGLDLYMTKKDGDSWSEPENLGSLINTSGNETSPFLDQGNNLFFSSDGYEGLGGFDIYICKYTGYGWAKPMNLTKSINTPDDDLAFTLSRPDGKSAFFTQRLKTGDKSARVFRVTFRDQSALNKLTSLSEAFKYIARVESTAAQPVIAAAATRTEVKPPDKDLSMVTARKQEPEKKVVNEPVKNVEKTAAETKPPIVKTQDLPDKKPVAEPVKPKPTETKPQPVSKPAVTASTNRSDAVVYRVQFAAFMKPKGSYEVTVGGKTYKTFEYFYNGGYRSCAGEFTTPAQAASLQKALKQAGYPDSFVVAFKNNVRSVDPALFK